MKGNDEFGFDIVSEGAFIDQGFNIKTVVIRLNSTALNEWIMSGVMNDRYVYDNRMEYMAHKKEKKKMQKAWEDKILNMFSFEKVNGGGYCISQNVSEIFTVVMFEKIAK